jgi:secondary thiamine-phosphate synthase enzyme
MWIQQEILLAAKKRGFHLITTEVVSALPVLSTVDCGLLHLFIKHTSASLTINENADPTVRMDLESHFNTFVPERAPYYRHDYEGDDDMPAHIKSSLLGSNLTIPITQGKLNLGVWQGIILCEHRNQGGRRTLVATLQGQASAS